METLFVGVLSLLGITLVSFILGALTTSKDNEDVGKTIRRGLFILLLLVLAWCVWRYLQQQDTDILNELENGLYNL